MQEEIQNIKNEALGQIMEVDSKQDIEQIKVKYLGRKGDITKLIKKVKELDPDEKRVIGKLINDTKEVISKSLDEQLNMILSESASKEEWFDLTIPGELPNVGSYHPLTIVLDKIVNVFSYLGYQVADGYEIENDYYNFEALNFEEHHPARDMQQTLFIDTKDSKKNFGDAILRTHTSSMQGRVMEKAEPPFRVLVPGNCYRYEQVDASHGFQFHQVEGFVVDENISLTDLFGTIEFVIKALFGEKAQIRFAATYFPFVEPGIDTYLKCTICNGKGCSFCKKTGWSEIMPAGMIHPNVLETAGIDSTTWNGFAFAIGTSRVVNLKYQIKDLRTLTTPDVRTLVQF